MSTYNLFTYVGKGIIRNSQKWKWHKYPSTGKCMDKTLYIYVVGKRKYSPGWHSTRFGLFTWPVAMRVSQAGAEWTPTGFRMAFHCQGPRVPVWDDNLVWS